jgi:hypothetical protein
VDVLNQASVKEKPKLIVWAGPKDEQKTSGRGILDVLERAAKDDDFIAHLTHDGQKALRGYRLTWREEAALLSGDIRWIESHVGELDARQRTWLDCRLQQENW